MPDTRTSIGSYSDGLNDVAVDVCCDAMVAALEGGTDSEMYGPFAEVNPDGCIDLCGYDLPKPKFCPWCAAPLVAKIGRPAATVERKVSYDVGEISRVINFTWKSPLDGNPFADAVERDNDVYKHMQSGKAGTT
ncbi:MAG: hypothetical protein AAGD43_29865 [Pseudomonadota bacterium]